MKAKDLMIGDLVKVHFGEHNETIGSDVYGQVAELYDDGRIEVAFNGSSSVLWNIEKERGDEILPIPLTPEILEKNGLIPSTTGAHFHEDKNFDLEISLPEKGEGDRILWTINVHEYIILPLLYVHELQHALKLCGIEKEIEL